MTIKKYVVISYCFAFLSIYLGSIAYALLSTSINNTYDTNLPQTTMTNSTVTAISSVSSWSGMISIIGIIAIILTIISIILSSRAMGAAI